MLDSNPLLQHLRGKSKRTKDVLAILAALIPTLAVSYAQFYMRARDGAQVQDSTNITEQTKDVSVFAAVGKIFDEGKKTVSASADSLRELNVSVFDSAPITATGSPSTTTTKDDKLDLGAVPGVDSYATVTKSIEN